MSKWINYRIDNNRQENPYIPYSKYLYGGKGKITNSLNNYTSSKYEYLGGSYLKPLSHNGTYGSISIASMRPHNMPLLPNPQYNRTRTRGLFYN